MLVGDTLRGHHAQKAPRCTAVGTYSKSPDFGGESKLKQFSMFLMRIYIARHIMRREVGERERTREKIASVTGNVVSRASKQRHKNGETEVYWLLI